MHLNGMEKYRANHKPGRRPCSDRRSLLLFHIFFTEDLILRKADGTPLSEMRDFPHEEKRRLFHFRPA